MTPQEEAEYYQFKAEQARQTAQAQQPQPIQPQPTPNYQSQTAWTETIQKKQAAEEVLKRLRQSKTLEIISISSLFITTLLNLFSSIMSLIFTGIASCFFIYLLFKDTNEIKYLEQKYGITPPQSPLKSFFSQR